MVGRAGRGMMLLEVNKLEYEGTTEGSSDQHLHPIMPHPHPSRATSLHLSSWDILGGLRRPLPFAYPHICSPWDPIKISHKQLSKYLLWIL